MMRTTLGFGVDGFFLGLRTWRKRMSDYHVEIVVEAFYPLERGPRGIY